MPGSRVGAHRPLPTDRRLADAKKRVLERIDSLKDILCEAISELVRIQSVNPSYPGCNYQEHVGGETRANQALAMYMERANCEVTWVELENGRANLVGVLRRASRGTGRSLILAGHIDTVPSGDPTRWTDGAPFSGRLDNGRIYGRGAADQKAGLVAQAVAAIALQHEGIQLNGDLILESLVGEEVGEHEIGVNGVINAGFRADGAVVSEPTGPPALSVAPVSAGLLWMTLHVSGKAGHNNLRPELVRAGGLGEVAGVNAIEKGTYLLAQLQTLEQQWGFTKGHPLFSPGHFTLHPGVIQGGAAQALVPFFISEYCTIDYSILYPPNEPVEDIRREIEDFLAAASSLDPWLKKVPPRVEWRLDWEPLILDPGHPLCRTVARAAAEAQQIPADGLASSVRGFKAVCDATYLNKAGIPSVVFGPGSILAAHAVDESVSVDEAVAATKAFALAAMDWCGLE